MSQGSAFHGDWLAQQVCAAQGVGEASPRPGLHIPQPCLLASAGQEPPKDMPSMLPLGLECSGAVALGWGGGVGGTHLDCDWLSLFAPLCG